VLGPVIGGFVVVLLQHNTQDLISGKRVLSPAIFGVVLIVLMYLLPDGAMGGIRRLAAYARRTVRRRGEPAPSTT
jgi:ABC-type branched-subunit amino acid transport system permease subunit